MSEVLWNSAKDRRREQRIAVNVDARLLPGGVPCRILDQSAGGARIRMLQPAIIPDTCVVIEWASGRAHHVQVMWRQNPEAGVRVLRSADLRGMVPAPFVAAKALWTKEHR